MGCSKNVMSMDGQMKKVMKQLQQETIAKEKLERELRNEKILSNQYKTEKEALAKEV